MASSNFVCCQIFKFSRENWTTDFTSVLKRYVSFSNCRCDLSAVYKYPNNLVRPGVRTLHLLGDISHICAFLYLRIVMGYGDMLIRLYTG